MRYTKDIRAKDESGREFLIEMQGSPHPFFPERLLFYWSKVYGAGIQKGMKYSGLSRVYSITFLNASLFKNTEDFHSTFLLLDKKTGKILLTNTWKCILLELAKVGSSVSNLQSTLESWAYFFKEVHNLKEDTLQELRSKNPMIEKAIDELEYLSQDEKTRQMYEEQLKAEFDYNSGIYAAFRDGKLEGELTKALETALRMREKGFSDQRMIDAINNVIDSCQYPTPTMANFLSFDKRVKIYTYNEVCDKVTKQEATFEDFEIIKISGEPYRIRKSDKNIYNILEEY
jgi:predicted transposase/invertase (TIGR01784 family)